LALAKGYIPLLGYNLSAVAEKKQKKKKNRKKQKKDIEKNRNKLEKLFFFCLWQSPSTHFLAVS